VTYIIEDEGRKINEIDIKRLEKHIKNTLPLEYKAFLQKNNGGRPTPNVFRVSELNNFGQVLDFFAIDDPVESCRIDWNFDVLSGRMPSGFLPIACEDGGNIICIRVDSRNCGKVYYWDHENETSPPGYQNVYKLADSLNEFLGNLIDLE
jgi:hypothetical protein